jgi:hypothetical protein
MAYREEDGAVIGRAAGGGWAASEAAPSIIPALHRNDLGESSPRVRAHTPERAPKLPRCPEIDCLRQLLPPSLVALAELHAAESDERADRILIAWGAISEADYVNALAAWLGIAIESLNRTSRQQCPLARGRLVETARTGMLPLDDADGDRLVVAPRLVDSRRLVTVATSGTALARRIRLTTAAELQSFAARHDAHDIEYRATHELRDKHPDLSASAGFVQPIAIGLGLAATALAAVVAPGPVLLVTELTLGLIFLAWTGLRFLGMLSSPLVRHRRRTFPDRELPTYTVIVALYREAAAVKGLVAALRRGKARHQIRRRTRRPRNTRRDCGAAAWAAVRDRRRAARRPAHQAQGAECGAAIRPRRLCCSVRRRGHPRPRPASPRPGCVRCRRPSAGLRSGPAHHRQHGR